MKERIVIVGAGAMGGGLATRLFLAGHEVGLIDRSPEVIDRVGRSGITLMTPDGETIHATPRIAGDIAALGIDADLVIFLVKGYGLPAAVASLQGHLREDAVLVCLQNGLGHAEILREGFPDNPIVLGSSYISITALPEGALRQTANGTTYLGASPLTPEAPDHDVTRILADASIPAAVESDIMTTLWKKLVLNAATAPTCALAGTPAAPQASYQPMLDLVDALAAEVVAVANAEGYPVELEERRETIRRVLLNAGDGKASMLQDFESGRRTEIDSMNGAVVAAAARHGVPVPLNQAMIALVSSAEWMRGLRD